MFISHDFNGRRIDDYYSMDTSNATTATVASPFVRPELATAFCIPSVSEKGDALTNCQ